MLGTRLKKQGKGLNHLLKIVQGPKEAFTDFFFSQRLTSAVNRKVSDSKARQIIIESLAFGNANSECKKKGDQASKGKISTDRRMD